MTFQDSLSTLNPIMKIGQQIAEVLTIRGIKKSTAKESTLELLRELGFDKPNEVYDFYPHQFSGGMRQRVMIAIALIANPRVLIADEPTTALDVRIQAQVMRLINKLAIERNLTVILISHDLGVVAGFADRVLVMYSGRIVEEGTTDEIFYESRHPYTKALLNSIPTVTRDPLIPLPAIKGVTPEPNQRLRGCVFQDRCTMVQHRCRNERPKLTMENYTHGYECFFPLELESFGVEPL
jgi:oligopeptide/dipeptide ABC transporter ATP-binding protein